MKFLTIITIYAYVTSFFLHLNNVISIYEKGLAIPPFIWSLRIVFLFGMLIFLPIVFRKIVVRRSLIFLAGFYTYWLAKVTLDMPTPINYLVLYTLTDRGGTLLYYLLGFMTSLSVRWLCVSVCQSTRAFNFFAVTLTFYLATTSLILIKQCLAISKSLVYGLLIISNYNNNNVQVIRDYQIVGDLLVVNLLITSIFVIFSLKLIFLTRKFLFQFWLLLLTIGYSTIVITTLYICLIAGANKASLSAVVISLLTVVIAFITQNSRVKNLLQTGLSQLRLKNWFSLSVLFRIILILVFVILLISALTYYLDFDIEKTRIFNFGSGGVNSSLEARDKIFQNNFMKHWTFSPIFGNMNVDAETTGRGTYSHSVPAYLLSHTGVVGFIMFWFYIFFATKELLHKPCIHQVGGQTELISNSFRVYSLALMICIFLLSSVATHLPWITLWFVMGFTFSPIGFIPRLKFFKVI